MEFKYKSTFSVTASLEKNSAFVSNASIAELEALKGLAPDNVDVQANPDLLYTVFNAAVVNLINLNGDGILTESAVKMAKYFKNKPVNIEHYCSEVIGCIQNVGFTSFPDNQVLSEGQALATSGPFNIALSAIIWKVVNPYFAQYLVDANDESDKYCYKNISASWEIGFNDYIIAVGSKNLSKATLITDAAGIKEKSKYLRRNGGNGFDENNEEVYLVITGDCTPLGVAFTHNPAAAVSGVLVIDPDCDCVEYSVKNDTSENKIEASIKEINDKLNILENKISQPAITIVKKSKSMKNFKNPDELYDCMSEAAAGEGPSAKDIRDFIKEQLIQADQKWKASVEAKEVTDAQLADALAKVADTNSQFEALKVQLEDIKATATAKENQDKFDARMSKLDETYELDAKARKLVTKNISNLSDADFDAWLVEDGSVILAGKEKQAPAVVTNPTDALKTAKASVANVPNSTEITPIELDAPKTVSVARKSDSFEISIK